MSDIEKLYYCDSSLGSKSGHRNGISENMLLGGAKALNIQRSEIKLN